jgi:hypothetical protein
MSNQQIEIQNVTHPSQILSKVALIRGISETRKHAKFDQIIPEIRHFNFAPKPMLVTAFCITGTQKCMVF